MPWSRGRWSLRPAVALVHDDDRCKRKWKGKAATTARAASGPEAGRVGDSEQRGEPHPRNGDAARSDESTSPPDARQRCCLQFVSV